MATWRRIALELFPEWEQDVRSPLSSPYSLFGDLLPVMHEAIRQEDDLTLQKIFSFAEWALRQPDNDLRNAAGVSFFEHVFDGPPRYWPIVAQWLSPFVVEQVMGLWKLMLQPSRFAEIQQLLHTRAQRQYPRVTEVWFGLPM